MSLPSARGCPLSGPIRQNSRSTAVIQPCLQVFVLFIGGTFTRRRGRHRETQGANKRISSSPLEMAGDLRQEFGSPAFPYRGHHSFRFARPSLRSYTPTMPVRASGEFDSMQAVPDSGLNGPIYPRDSNSLWISLKGIRPSMRSRRGLKMKDSPEDNPGRYRQLRERQCANIIFRADGWRAGRYYSCADIRPSARSDRKYASRRSPRRRRGGFSRLD